MLVNFAWAAALVFGTTLIHTLFTIGAIVWIRTLSSHHWALRNVVTRATALAVLVLAMSLAAYLESLLWAGFYVFEGALATIEDATYFSLVTFTTLGYGDITLEPQWRVLAAFQAANGILLFGWTTAIIVAVARRLFVFDRDTPMDA